MSIEVLNPYNGQAVKVRPQDVGKAMKDREGRMFYVLERPEGTGHYTAPNKAGGHRDIERYDKMFARSGQARQSFHEQSQAHIQVERKKAGIGKLIKLLIAFLILAAIAWFVYNSGMIGNLTEMAPPPADS